MTTPSKAFVVHVCDGDASDKLHDYSVHQRIDRALQQSAANAVVGWFGEAHQDLFDAELAREPSGIEVDPDTERRHVRCGAWRAHVDERHVRA